MIVTTRAGAERAISSQRTSRARSRSSGRAGGSVPRGCPRSRSSRPTSVVETRERLGALDLRHHQAVERRGRPPRRCPRPGQTGADSPLTRTITTIWPRTSGGRPGPSRGRRSSLRRRRRPRDRERSRPSRTGRPSRAGGRGCPAQRGGSGASALPVDRWTSPGTRPTSLYSISIAAATPPLAPPRHLTKTELALELLRERIQSGELAPGQRLAIDELTRLLGMSATPIREALRLLQADRPRRLPASPRGRRHGVAVPR